MQKIVRKRIHYACVMALIVVTCVVQGCEKKVEKKVFSVTADAKISNDEGNKRLQIIVDIDNISDEDYKNVTYSLTLNKEVEPYIANGIITFVEDSKINVISYENEKVIKDNNAEVSVTGFQHEWDMLLTTKDDLTEYWGIAQNGIYDALKAVTVEITWNGGKQEETVPLNLKK